MAGWHHQLDGHGFGYTLGVGDGQGGLACCDSWGCKESDTTEWLNWTELNWNYGENGNYKINSLKILAISNRKFFVVFAKIRKPFFCSRCVKTFISLWLWFGEVTEVPRGMSTCLHASRRLFASFTLGKVIKHSVCSVNIYRMKNMWDFPDGPVVKTLSSSAGGTGFIPGPGAKFPHASQPKTKNKKHILKQKQYCNKFNKDFKDGPHQKDKKVYT